MKTVDIKLPAECKPSNIGFATTLVSKACTYTSEDINIKTKDGSFVNLKSIMGVLTLNYHDADTITLQVMGEMEDLTANSLERFIQTELKKYSY